MNDRGKIARELSTRTSPSQWDQSHRLLVEWTYVRLRATMTF